MNCEGVTAGIVVLLIGVLAFVVGFGFGHESGINEGTNTVYRSLLEKHQILAPVTEETHATETTKETKNVR